MHLASTHMSTSREDIEIMVTLVYVFINEGKPNKYNGINQRRTRLPSSSGQTVRLLMSELSREEC